MKFSTYALAGGILLTGAFHASAASKKETSPAPAEPTPAIQVVHQSTRPLPFNGKVASLDKIAKTFSTENKEKKFRTYEITAETTFAKINGSATWNDVKIGDEVRGYAVPKGEGRFETTSIIIGAREEPKVLPASTPAATAVPVAKPAKTPKKVHASPSPSPSPSKKVQKTD